MFAEKEVISPDQKIRVGLVGCGRIAKNHISALKQHSENIDIVALCDTEPKNLEVLGKGLEVNRYSSLEAMLDREDIHLATICTPSGLHASQAIYCGHRNVNVVVEKPMATTYQDGLRMIKVFDQTAKRLFVVKQNRFNKTLQLLKRALIEKRFGNIKMVAVNVFWTRPQSYYDQDKGWRGKWEFDGGAFMNQASHYFDLLHWLIGPVQTVHAMTSTTRDIEAEDTGVVNVKWRNGALGSVCVTMLTYPQNLEGSITILGDSGTAKVGGVAVNKIDHWAFKDTADYDSEVSASSYVTESVYGNGHEKYYGNVIDVLRGKSLPLTDGRSGIKSLEILSAAYLSSRDGVSVSLPLNSDL